MIDLLAVVEATHAGLLPLQISEIRERFVLRRFDAHRLQHRHGIAHRHRRGCRVVRRKLHGDLGDRVAELSYLDRLRPGGKTVECELTVRLRYRDGAAALERDARVAQRLPLLVEHATGDARRSLGDALYLAAVALDLDDRLLLRHDGEAAQREEAVRHLGRYLAGADAIAEDLNLAAHVTGQTADLVAAGRVDGGFAISELFSSNEVRLVKH